MKCDLCRLESDFDAAFVKERKSLRFSQRTLCPACWVQRRNRRESRFLVAMGVAGVCGYVLHALAPDAFMGQFLLNLFLITLFLIFSVLPHELGHAIVGWALGWRVYQIVIGVGKPLFKRRWFGILFDFRTVPLAGATWMTPKDTRWFRVKRFLSVLAGPAVNVGMALAVILIWQGSLSDFDFDALPSPVRLFLWANLWVAVANLWPHQSKSGFSLPSDGKQLLQTLSFKKESIEQVQAMRYALEAALCRERGDLAGARSWCEKGLALYPEDRHLLNLSGVNHLDEQDYPKARDVFLKLLARDDLPKGSRFLFLNNLAYADALSDNPAWIAEADAYSNDAYAALPWVAAVVGTRGTVLVAKGNLEEGMNLLRKSMADAESPRNKAENACHMAIALARCGRNSEARNYLDLAAKLDGKCPLLAKTERVINTVSANNSKPRSPASETGRQAAAPR